MNNFNNNQQFQKVQQMMQNPSGFRTESKYKIPVSLIMGVVPMLLAWIIFRSSSLAHYDPWFMNAEGTMGFLPIVDIGYGFMWLIGLAALGISVLVTYLAIRFDKKIKPDVFVPTITLTVFMMNFYLFPFIGNWRFLTAIPMFMLGGFISKSMLMFYIIYKAQKAIRKMQGQMGNAFGGGQGGNPFQNFGNPFGNNQNKQNNIEDVSEVKEDKKIKKNKKKNKEKK